MPMFWYEHGIWWGSYQCIASKTALTYYNVLHIGTSAGLKMLDLLSSEDQQKILSSDEVKNFYRPVIKKYDDVSLLMYIPVKSDNGSSHYTINLHSLRPTKNSLNKTLIDEQTKEHMRETYRNLNMTKDELLNMRLD